VVAIAPLMTAVLAPVVLQLLMSRSLVFVQSMAGIKAAANALLLTKAAVMRMLPTRTPMTPSMLVSSKSILTIGVHALVAKHHAMLTLT